MVLSIFLNNWVYLLLSGVSIAYNLYSNYTKNYSFTLMIANYKENYQATSRISFFYKIKFVYYIIASIISLTITILVFLKNVMDDDIDLTMLKII